MVSTSQQPRLCSCSLGISEGWADPRRCSRRGLRSSPHGNNLESFPACVASLSCVLPSFSLPSGGRQSFNAFMFEKHFEVLEEGATEERRAVSQMNCFCFARSHSCECRRARWQQDGALGSPCPRGPLDSSSAEAPRHQGKAEQDFHSCSQAGNPFWRAQWPDLHRQNGGNSPKEWLHTRQVQQEHKAGESSRRGELGIQCCLGCEAPQSCVRRH